MKKILALAMAAALCVAALSGCSNANKDDASSAANTATNGTLVMATEAGFAPYEYLKGEEIVGIDVDIAKEIAAELGKELVINDMKFDSALLAVQSEQADFAAAGISVTPERQEKMDFSVEYATSKQVVVVKKGDTSITKEADLASKVIGGQAGTTAELVYGDKEYDVQPKELKTYTKYAQAAQDLKTGGIDCIVMDELPAKLMIAKTDGLEIAQAELFTDKYGLAIKKGNTELKEAIDKVLNRLIQEGKIDEYTTKHSEEALG